MPVRQASALILILLGVLFTLNNFFDLQISVFRLLLAIGMISLGIILLRGRMIPFGNGIADDGSQTVLFGKASSYAGGGAAPEHYSTLFGERKLYLERIDTTEKFLRVTTWFGETTIIIPRDLPLTIRANAIFGEVAFPDGQELNFGDRIFEHQPQGEGRSVVMEISMGFGEVKCIWV
jgi:hypothetical protein